MKIEVKEATVTTNVPKENVKAMTISASGMEHIMKLLTNLYKDPELAVIREYYTNAADAHVAAKTDVPVLITLPTWDDPVYRVQDWGIGMSEWDIKNIYSEYGASTKRDTNEQVGAFGLGCKSAFTIANQFTVVSVKDGLKCTTLFSKVINGTYESTVISTVETPEPNGTIVKIPVSSNLQSFRDKAVKFFSFSPPGSVLVDGQQPKYKLEGAEKMSDPKVPGFDIFVEPGKEGESYVIMGSVPYALSQPEVELSLERINARTNNNFIRMPKYIPAPIGSVDLTPSREGLMFTQKTKDFIDSYINFLVNDLRDLAFKDLDKIETLEEFFPKYRYWNNIISIPRQWKGEDVPLEINTSKYMRIVYRGYGGYSSHSETSYMRLDQDHKYIVVSGYTSDEYKKVSRWLTAYMDSVNTSTGNFIITDAPEPFDNKWIKQSGRFTYMSGDDIIEKGKAHKKKERLANRAPGSKEKIQYPVLTVKTGKITWLDYDQIADETPYIKQSECNGDIVETIKYTYQNIGKSWTINDHRRSMFDEVFDEPEIILLNNVRGLDALQKRVKGAESLRDQYTSLYTKAEALITDEVKRYHTVKQSGWKKFLSSTGIDAKIDSVKDTKLKEIIVPTQAVLDAYERHEFLQNISSYFAYAGEPKVPTINYKYIDTTAIEALDAKYPLVNSINTWNLDEKGVDHIIKYLNFIHDEHSNRVTV